MRKVILVKTFKANDDLATEDDTREIWQCTIGNRISSVLTGERGKKNQSARYIKLYRGCIKGEKEKKVWDREKAEGFEDCAANYRQSV